MWLQNLIYLGQTNAIFADSLTIARQKANASLRFNSAFANAAAIFRGADGSSRVGAWMIADNSLQSTARVPRWARMTLAADGSMPWWIQWCLEKTKRRRAQTALAYYIFQRDSRCKQIANRFSISERGDERRDRTPDCERSGRDAFGQYDSRIGAYKRRRRHDEHLW